MILLKNISESEEAILKDGTIAIARRIYEDGEHSKEFIVQVTGLTDLGYEEVIKRVVIMDCARKFVERFRIEFLQQELNLSENEMQDLIKYKEGGKEKEVVEE